MPADLSSLLSPDARARAVHRTAPPAPVVYDFDAGWPAPEAYPVEVFKRLAADVLDDATALGYRSVVHDPSGHSIYNSATFPGRLEMQFGYPRLREQVAEWISRREGVGPLTIDNVMLTAGATQAIALAAAAFVQPGEGALIEELTYAYAFKSLELRGGDVRRIDVDEHGMVIESLEQRLAELRRDGVRPKLLYTIPTFHLPTGTVLPLDRRQRLLELAEEWDFVVVEDALYSCFGYDGIDLPPSLLSLDRSGRVLQVNSFSKTIAPALRIGWVVGPPEIVEALAGLREDLGVSQWLSRVLSEFMAEGRLDMLIDDANGHYRRKRDLAVEQLGEHGAGLVTFPVPHGGFYLWVTFDDAIDWAAAEATAAASGVVVRSADAFMQNGRPKHFRLGFGHTSERELREGIPLLGQALASATRR